MNDIRFVPCTYCAKPIDATSPHTWRRVVGWERKTGKLKNRGGGGSDITLREPRDQYACDPCVRRLKAGVSPLQEAFL